MGLLDSFDGLGEFLKTPEGIGLLSGVAGYAANAQRGTPVNNIGRGALTGVMGYNNAQDQQMQVKQAEQMGQLRAMQIDQMNRQLKLNQSLGEALKGGGQSQSVLSALANGNGPTVENAATLNNLNAAQLGANRSPGQVMADAARQAGDWEAYQKAQSLLLEEKKLAPKYATDVRVINVGGKPTAVQMADDGSWKPMGENVAPAEKLSFQNLGGTTVGVDPYTGKPVATMKHTMSPDAVASNSLGWANFNLSKQRDNAPTFNESAGGWVYKPTKDNPTGQVVAIPGLPGKPLTEVQGKATGFASRMAEAEKVINDPSTVEKPSAIENVAGAIPLVGDYAANASRSPDRQKYYQAQQDWVRAKLRLESGAVIGKDEMDSEIRTYFPQQGDSPEVIAQKAAARRTALDATAKQAGPQFKTPEAPKPRSKQVSLDDGSKIIASLGGDGNYYVTKGGKKYRVEE